MANDEKPGNIQGEGNDGAHPASFPLKSAGEVVVTQLDSPPPSGKKAIHPRRVAPTVPTREEREAGQAPSEESHE
jgi:hypothetical protein